MRIKTSSLRKKNTINNLLIASLLTISLLLNLSLNARTIKPVAKDGILDLSNYNFESSGTIQLNGKWKYLKNRFLSLQGIQKSKSFGFVDVPKDLKGQICANDTVNVYGYGTYCLKIILNKEYANKYFLLKTHGIISSSKVFVNDKLVGYNGTISKSVHNALPELEPHFNEFTPNTDTLFLTIQTSNYLIHSSGLFFSIEMGLEKEIVKQRIIKV